MTRAAIAVAVVLATGCGGYEQCPPSTRADREVITSAALHAWATRFGPVPDCWTARAQLRWDVLPEDTLAAACTTDVVLDGCMHFDAAGAPVISVAADTPRSVEQLNELHAHELTHWLQSCSGRMPDGDGAHADPEVWPAQIEATLAELER